MHQRVSRAHRSPIVLLTVVGALLVLGARCEEPPDPSWTDTPSQFAEVGARGFVYKAVSPDGSVIGVRHRENEEKADLAYWAEVFQLEMVEAKGYKLVDTRDVKSKDGVLGKQLIFEFAQGDIPYHYGLGLYVTEGSIVTLETATELASLERYQGAFDDASAALNATLGDKRDK